jgi:hypothetical protein
MKTKIKPVKDGIYRVVIEEYERGWGSRVDDVLHFVTESDAKQYCKEYNDKYNPPGPVPDWYMKARYIGAK